MHPTRREAAPTVRAAKAPLRHAARCGAPPPPLALQVREAKRRRLLPPSVAARLGEVAAAQSADDGGGGREARVPCTRFQTAKALILSRPEGLSVEGIAKRCARNAGPVVAAPRGSTDGRCAPCSP